MVSIVRTRTFQTGNSVAVRLPKAYGVSANEPVELVRDGKRIELRLGVDVDFERAQLAEMLDRLDRVGPVEGGDPNDGRIEFPDRPGLY
jgi:antitoxin VapB